MIIFLDDVFLRPQNDVIVWTLIYQLIITYKYRQETYWFVYVNSRHKIIVKKLFEHMVDILFCFEQSSSLKKKKINPFKKTLSSSRCHDLSHPAHCL